MFTGLLHEVDVAISINRRSRINNVDENFLVCREGHEKHCFTICELRLENREFWLIRWRPCYVLRIAEGQSFVLRAPKLTAVFKGMLFEHVHHILSAFNPSLLVRRCQGVWQPAWVNFSQIKVHCENVPGTILADFQVSSKLLKFENFDVDLYRLCSSLFQSWPPWQRNWSTASWVRKWIPPFFETPEPQTQLLDL